MASRVRGLSKSVHSISHDAFRAAMKQARQRAGLTQHELAALLGKPQSFVAKYEGGERRLDVIEFTYIVQTMSQDPLSILRTLMRKTD
jgi:transcriptional regulator with XRE-family HTH domain